MGKRPIIIGVAGGTGSGKTTVAKEIFYQFNEKSIVLIEQDAYYKDQSQLSLEERLQTNYDHPLAFDNDLLIEHLHSLLNGQAIEKPVYDYKLHTRSNEVILVEPKDVIILEGILLLEDERLRELMDIKLFVDTDADIRIIRRMVRDIRERGRTLESVIEQYTKVVRPMHMQFIEPTKRYADVIIPEGGQNRVAIDLMVTKIRAIIEEKAVL
ncbi:uridine kinase [Halalkalibacterium halodurans]|uniref:Uridine kinase n=2 Tax=Halalkalibacterium halodurans TaxID=86665 RepID=URK_HALH5|nr:uridine kinase [Halalkalibacterium halodurans]Q9KDD8.1 RecName: Full=Uridine kinase; AltName: Full=Cytidine monophosphokinase; AltName: Full=Uridine monophosphokinase [Halalkalibacterium halodurans C-125]MDY7221801.1 uridine kinase [Halalkalibacterium halodurans]MDY7241077.1 uridine kinase [Halalkalibacterium halodurans]MED4081874.1 uridine kinase [Halalkalibacterium halodurans]MED4086000.1 uridine kinase [Halalkalibacterium halodurans]MED4106808.1 uridine kinase [Halalkalibacterium halodu